MSDFSHPWNDGDGVKGLWPNGRGPRNEQVFRSIETRRTEHLRLCRIWRAAAEADGWVFGPTYVNEPVDSAFKGTREGFTIQGIARPGKPGEKSPSASVHIWGPDGMVVRTPLEYSMNAIRAGARTCNYCGATDVDTVRVGFAGRCCKSCEPTIRPQIETFGWNR